MAVQTRDHGLPRAIRRPDGISRLTTTTFVQAYLEIACDGDQNDIPICKLTLQLRIRSSDVQPRGLDEACPGPRVVVLPWAGPLASRMPSRLA